MCIYIYIYIHVLVISIMSIIIIVYVYTYIYIYIYTHMCGPASSAASRWSRAGGPHNILYYVMLHYSISLYSCSINSYHYY